MAQSCSDSAKILKKCADNHADGTEYSFYAASGEGYFTYYHRMSGRMIGFTRSDSGVTTWTGSDIVGSTSATRDESGQVATHRYTPFGETRTDGNLDTDHLFTGQILDESSGLAFYNARYYDPAIGRFITPDSIVPNPLNGQDYNRYTYVRNNPVKYNDPTGNCPTLCTAQDRADVNEVLARGAATVSAPVRNTSGGSHTEVSTQTFTQRASNPTFTYNQSATVDGAGGINPACSGAIACLDVAVDRAVTIGRVGFFDERSCRSNQGTGGFELDVGCEAEAAAAFPLFKIGKFADRLNGVVRSGRNAPSGLSDDVILSRGGTKIPDRFAAGSGVSVDSSGNLSGVSVNSGSTIEDATRGIPHNQVGVTTVGDVRAAGGSVVADPTPGNPSHCLISGCDALTLSDLFTPTIKNPHR